MQRGFIFSLLFSILVAIFALKNSDKVIIDFIFKKVKVSQPMVILISAILGAITVSVLGCLKKFKMKKEIKELNRRLEFAERERNDLTFLLGEQNEEALEYDEENQDIN